MKTALITSLVISALLNIALAVLAVLVFVGGRAAVEEQQVALDEAAEVIREQANEIQTLHATAYPVESQADRQARREITERLEQEQAEFVRRGGTIGGGG